VIVYLDTSAFAKLILDEDGAADARSWFGQGWPAISSVVTYPEACSALQRRSHRAGGKRDLSAWLSELDARWRRVLAIRVDAPLAGRLAVKHRLRGMDAVQLAAAIGARERLRPADAGEDLRFAAFDRELREAAEREGFTTLGGPLS
jgi:predicted nucleic acid-binding protein